MKQNKNLNDSLDDLISNLNLPTDEEIFNETWVEKIKISKKNYEYLPTSEETKKKLSEALIGIKKGKMPDETKEKLRIINTGKVTSEETKKKQSEALIGIKKGKMSDETKEKLRKSKKELGITEAMLAASEKQCVPIIVTNLKTGNETIYSSTKVANDALGLTGLLHVLKGRQKQCGGYAARYVDESKNIKTK
jgi:hypothetical protein